jgi:hypothetical protein
MAILRKREEEKTVRKSRFSEDIEIPNPFAAPAPEQGNAQSVQEEAALQPHSRPIGPK